MKLFLRRSLTSAIKLTTLPSHLSADLLPLISADTVFQNPGFDGDILTDVIAAYPNPAFFTDLTMNRDIQILKVANDEGEYLAPVQFNVNSAYLGVGSSLGNNGGTDFTNTLTSAINKPNSFVATANTNLLRYVQKIGTYNDGRVTPRSVLYTGLNGTEVRVLQTSERGSSAAAPYYQVDQITPGAAGFPYSTLGFGTNCFAAVPTSNTAVTQITGLLEDMIVAGYTSQNFELEIGIDLQQDNTYQTDYFIFIPFAPLTHYQSQTVGADHIADRTYVYGSDNVLAGWIVPVSTLLKEKTVVLNRYTYVSNNADLPQAFEIASGALSKAATGFSLSAAISVSPLETDVLEPPVDADSITPNFITI